MGLIIGNGIGIPFNKQSELLSSYWATRTITGLFATVDSDTQITLNWVNNGTLDYTGHKAYISTDGVNFSLNKTVASIETSMVLTGLTINTLYYVYIKPYKESNEGTASSIDNIRTSSILLSDLFAGATISNSKWVETDPGAKIAQNNAIVMTCPHTGTISEFTDRLESVASIASGVAVIQGNLTWVTDSAQETLGGIYLYKDSQNFACISSRNADGSTGKYRLRIIIGGSSVYSFSTAITKGKDVKIWTDGTTIKFYYWNSTAWTQMGTDQTFSLGANLKYVMSFTDNAIFTGADTITVDNAYMSIEDYTTRYPALSKVLNDVGNCWFTRRRALYNSSINKTWITQVHNDGSGYTQHILTLDNSNGSVSTSKVGGVVYQDDHDEPSILLRSSDNKLFIAYSGHAADQLVRFRISSNALDASAWEAESTVDAGDNVTYMSSFESVNGNIYIFGRGSTNGWFYLKSTNGGVSFAAKVLFVKETGDRPYCIPAQSPINKNIIHFVMSMGHPTESTNPNPIGAFYFDCSTDKFYKLDGSEITATIPFDTIGDITLVMDNVEPDTGWVEDIIIDSTGNPRYLLTFHPNGQGVSCISKDLYYAEWNGSAITTPCKIHDASDVFIGGHAYTYAYPPGSCFLKSNPNVIIASKYVDGVCEIHRITRNSYNDFTALKVTSNKLNDQWRPFTSEGSKRNVFWLNKADYTHYVTFSQSLVNGTIV